MANLANTPSQTLKTALDGKTYQAFSDGNQKIAVVDNRNGTFTITDVNAKYWYRYRGDKCEQVGSISDKTNMHLDAGHLLGLIKPENRIERL